MCGISGIVSFYSDVDPARVDAMNAIQVHRGPDASGVWHGGDVAFGFQRLAIVDVAGGEQPTHSEDGRVRVVFNGEIYNHVELRRRLAARGHRFRNKSDAEVIPHLYEEYGTEFAEQLDGDFAIAIWDGRARRLVLARDRVGVKPLFYHHADNTVVFASEIKGIFASGICTPTPDPQGLSDSLFYGHPIAPGTFWQGVNDLPPATVLTIDASGTRSRTYFRPFHRADPTRPLLSGSDGIDAFRATFTEAVRKRIPDEVAAGVTLSGGLDSSSIAATAARRCDSPLDTFSIRLEGAIHDETPMSRLVASDLGVANDEIPMTGELACTLISKSLWHFESPFWYGAVATPYLALMDQARDAGYKVLLSGDGSDELLAGYDFYRLMKLDARLGRLRLGALRPRLWQQAMKWLGAPTGFDAQVVAVAERSQQYTHQFGEIPPWIYLWSAFGDATAGLVADLPTPSILPPPPPHDKLRRQLHFEFYTRIPHWILPISDRLGMAGSIEMRVPFLDRDVIDLCAELDPNLLLRFDTEKYVLKRSTSDILPKPVVQQRKKPFLTPIGDWYLTGPGAELAGDHLSQSATARFGLFDPVQTERLWQTAIAEKGTWRGTAAEMATMAVLTTHLVLEQFCGDRFRAGVAP